MSEPEHIEVAPGQQDGAKEVERFNVVDMSMRRMMPAEHGLYVKWIDYHKLEAALTQAREQVRDLAQGVIDEYSPCVFDENRPRLRWCMTHNTKRCTQKELADKARSALASSQPGKET